MQGCIAYCVDCLWSGFCRRLCSCLLLEYFISGIVYIWTLTHPYAERIFNLFPSVAAVMGALSHIKPAAGMNVASGLHLHCHLPCFIGESWSANHQLLSKPYMFWNISWHMAEF
jgi:hypothetical protein